MSSRKGMALDLPKDSESEGRALGNQPASPGHLTNVEGQSQRGPRVSCVPLHGLSPESSRVPNAGSTRTFPDRQTDAGKGSAGLVPLPERWPRGRRLPPCAPAHPSRRAHVETLSPGGGAGPQAAPKSSTHAGIARLPLGSLGRALQRHALIRRQGAQVAGPDEGSW